MFRYVPCEWILVKAGFITSAHPDVYVGFHSANFQSLKQAGASVFVNLNTNINNFNTSILRAFISGFKLKSGKQIFIRCFEKSIKLSQIQMVVQVAGSMQITQAQLNYVMFSPRESKFASYGGGQTEINLIQQKIYDIQKNLHHSDYKFYGITTMRHSAQSPLVILTEISSDFNLKISSIKQSRPQQVYISYILLGVPPAQMCSNCPGSKAIAQYECSDQCPIDSYIINYKDGGVGCRRCNPQQNRVPNQARTTCICKSGFLQTNGHCISNSAEKINIESYNTKMIARITQGLAQYRLFKQNSQIYSMPQIPNKLPNISITNTASSAVRTSRTTNMIPMSLPINSMGSTIISNDQVAQYNKNKGTYELNSIKLINADQNIYKDTNPTTIYRDTNPKNNIYGNINTNSIIDTNSNNNININTDINTNTNINNNGNNNIDQTSDDLYRQRIIPSSDMAQHIKRTSNTVKIVNNKNYDESSYIINKQPQLQQNIITANPKTTSRIINSYIPTIPNNILTTTLAPGSKQLQNSKGGPSGNIHYPNQLSNYQEQIRKNQLLSKQCAKYQHTYWSGYQCACKVGYAMSGGVCAPITFNPTHRRNYRPSQFINKISALSLSKPQPQIQISFRGLCNFQNQIYDGKSCICMAGFQRNKQGRCIQVQYETGYQLLQDKQLNEQLKYLDQYPLVANMHLGQQIPQIRNTKHKFKISCPPGSKLIDGECKLIQKCPQNFTLSQEGKCVCNLEFTLHGDRCIKKVTCGPNSQQDVNGVCRCLKGYRIYQNNICSLCPPRYILIQGKCQHPCGVNQFYNQSKNKCQCIQGYGLYDGVCQKCTSQFFVSDGYCVTCPINSQFDETARKCVCMRGFIQTNGICMNICNNTQQYNLQSNKCKCKKGLARINGSCSLCLSGYVDQSTQKCIQNCKQNEIRIGGKCICKPGFGYGSDNMCMKCEHIPGGYLLIGHCGVCPSNTVYINNKCDCARGMKMHQNKCIQECPPGQIIDSSGHCYSCPMNQQIINSKCACKKGFERVNNTCMIKCLPGQVQINGICAECAFNMIYCPLKKSCKCRQGHYVNSYGFCQLYVPQQMICRPGRYYDKPTQMCQQCKKGCGQCKRIDQCLSCRDQGYYLFKGQCKARCGDGIRVQDEACDDGNLQNFDGCSSVCKVQNSFDCFGDKPTKCYRSRHFCGDGILDENQECDDKNYDNFDGCYNCKIQLGWICTNGKCVRKHIQAKLQSKTIATKSPSLKQMESNSIRKQGINLKLLEQPRINSQNIFIRLQTPTNLTFSSETQMRYFIKCKFKDSDTASTSTFCRQKIMGSKLFECLFLYALGVPSKIFTINFSYQYQNKVGDLNVLVNTKNNISVNNKSNP